MNMNWHDLLNEALGAAIGTALGIGVLGYGLAVLLINSLEALF